MIPFTRGSILVVITLSMMFALASSAGEQKVPLNKLPKEVAAAVKAKFPKAVPAYAVKSGTTYEVTLKAGKLGIDVTVTAGGKILQVERELELKDLPVAVADALAAKYPLAGKIKRIEELSKDDKIISYEMLIETGKKRLEVYFDPQGKFLHEKELTPKKAEKAKPK